MALAIDQSKGRRRVASCLDLCLDFANTLYGRGGMPTESLREFVDLLRWCADKDLAAKAHLDELRFWSENHRDQAVETLAQAIGLRESIYGIFAQLAVKQDVPSADLDDFNRAIATTPARNRIQRSEDGFSWCIPHKNHSAVSLLAPVLWSAGDLLSGKCLDRVRLCANHKCLWLFLDDSLGGHRRWCSMSACGNRAKTQRHYLRRKAG